MCLIIKHDEPIELLLKHFYVGLPHGLGSFMSHSKSDPNILGHIQAIHMVALFFVHG
jgi:hypothetical protein